MIKYPSTEQFRHIIRQVQTQHDYQGKDAEGKAIYAHKTPYPALLFEGTVKLHGTNGAIVLRRDQKPEFQSRERVLTFEKDNAGFYAAMSAKDLTPFEELLTYHHEVVIYGEWCGGNIQKGVAINGLPKMFVVFALLVDGEWLRPSDSFKEELTSQGIYSIRQFPTFKVVIDFNNPEAIQNTLIDLTLQVEEKCPVGAYFGQEGIGEGIVFTCIDDPSIRFKSKGDKHSVSKVTKLNAVDTESIAEMKEFVELAVTEERLKQGIEYLKEQGLPVTQQSTGTYLKWIVGDVMKEEADTIAKSGFEFKKLNPLVSKKAKEFFFAQIC